MAECHFFFYASLYILIRCGYGDTSQQCMRLSLERERRTDLVRSLVEVLGIERSTETEGDTGSELDVVGKRGDTTVIDFGLSS